MKLNVVTIVLNGMPFIRHHFDQLKALKSPWHWVVVEGTAKNVQCTKWCKEIPAGLSTDGTSEYLASIAVHPNVTVVQRPLWNGKIEMLNLAVGHFTDPGILLEVDSDELWTTVQLERLIRMFRERPAMQRATFFCRYFVGEKIVTVGDNCYGNYGATEWQRAWRFSPGMVFQRHETPIFNHNQGPVISRQETKIAGLVFDHKAYVTEAQIAFKERYYGYAGAVEQWRRLQSNTQWPVKRLKDFLPWVDERVGANLLA